MVHDRAVVWYAPIVRNAWRIVGGVVALGLVVYAIVALTSGGSSSTGSSDRKPKRVASANDSDGDEPDAKSKRVKTLAKRGAEDGKTARVQLGLNAAKPTSSAEIVDYDEARTELEKMVDQVEEMAAHGEHMQQQAWVELYKKGDILMVGLMRTPEVTSSDAVRSEISKLNQRFRMSVTKIGPAPTE